MATTQTLRGKTEINLLFDESTDFRSTLSIVFENQKGRFKGITTGESRLFLRGLQTLDRLVTLVSDSKIIYQPATLNYKTTLLVILSHSELKIEIFDEFDNCIFRELSSPWIEKIIHNFN